MKHRSVQIDYNQYNIEEIEERLNIDHRYTPQDANVVHSNHLNYQIALLSDPFELWIQHQRAENLSKGERKSNRMFLQACRALL